MSNAPMPNPVLPLDAPAQHANEQRRLIVAEMLKIQADVARMVEILASR